MNVSSYFKSSGQFFFFNDSDVYDTVRAFTLALAAGTDVSVYRVPFVAGPWDKIGVVGFRLRKDIVQEISMTEEADRLASLAEELSHLERAYVRAGRSESAVFA